MATSLLNDEIVSALAWFFYGGSGPTHTELTRAFRAAGYGDDDPYDPQERLPNKQERVLSVGAAAVRRPAGERKLIDGLLSGLRQRGCFRDPEFEASAENLRRVALRAGWRIDAGGYFSTIGAVDLETGGRAALDEQLSRIQRSIDDPGALLGTAKDLLEAICRFVLEEWGALPAHRMKFDHMLHLALDRLDLLPADVDMSQPGAKEVRTIRQSSITIAKAVRDLRNLQGTGHGRTLPTGVTPEVGRYVIREAAHVAELMLGTHDRRMGRTS